MRNLRFVLTTSFAWAVEILDRCSSRIATGPPHRALRRIPASPLPDPVDLCARYISPAGSQGAISLRASHSRQRKTLKPAEAPVVTNRPFQHETPHLDDQASLR